MSRGHDPQLLKGILSPLLLQLLAERESYGYELAQRVRELGLPDITDGTIYPAMARLEREAKVTTRLVPSRSGPARKYYRPTAAGYQALAEAAAMWQTLTGIITPALARPVPPQPAPPTEES